MPTTSAVLFSIVSYGTGSSAFQWSACVLLPLTISKSCFQIMATLKDWSVSHYGDIVCLRGIVSGHSYLPDGKMICTSQIKNVDGLTVWTGGSGQGGSVYQLGEPSRYYLGLLEGNGVEYGEGGAYIYFLYGRGRACRLVSWTQYLEIQKQPWVRFLKATAPLRLLVWNFFAPVRRLLRQVRRSLRG